MGSRSRPGPGVDPADVVVFGSFLLVPLAVSTTFAEPFISPKWYLLELTAVGWFVLERLRYGSSHAWPAFLRRARIVAVIFAVLTFLQSVFLGGLVWALPPLLARTSVLLLALSAFWYFRRNHLQTNALDTGFTTAGVAVVTMGLLQFAGWWPLPWPVGGDPFSATLGNVNMAAQVAALAVVVRLSLGTAARRASGIVTEALAAGGFAYVYLAGTRSVGLALGAALLFLVCVGRVTPARLVRATAGAAALVLLVLHPWTRDGAPAGRAGGAGKARSAEMRLDVWEDTLDLIRDHPLGVGAGNFERAFIPYALAGRSRPDESMVFRSPHNEYLKVLAEHGLLGAGLLAALLALLGRELHRSPSIAGWRSGPGALLGSCGAFIAVEAFFQFPFELGVPALLSAVLLGLAWACVEPDDALARADSRRWLAHLTTVLVALAVTAGLVRIVAADSLSVAGDIRSLERACAWDGTRLKACLDAAWLHGRAGEHEAARRLVDGVLQRSPHYFPALKLRGEEALALGDVAAGCRDLEAYDALFGGRSAVSALVRQRCGTPARP